MITAMTISSQRCSRTYDYGIARGLTCSKMVSRNSSWQTLLALCPLMNSSSISRLADGTPLLFGLINTSKTCLHSVLKIKRQTKIRFVILA